MLEHHADFTAHIGGLAGGQGKVRVVDADVALLGDFQAVDAADQRGLSRTRRPAQDNALAFAHVQVDVAQHMIGAVVFVQSLDADHNLARVGVRGRAGCCKAQ
ncbi:hypothetical protein D3C80_1702600 [compost metagenome]